jgi:hypothetical protein
MKLIALAVALALTAAPKGKAPPKGSSKTMKGLVKDAATSSGPATDALDGGAPEAPPRPEGYPDIDKLPFTPLSIQNVVTFFAPKIQGCYEETLAGKQKAVEGALLTSFTITPAGLVKKPSVVKKGTTLKDPKLHECVVAVISTMQFPKPSDGKDHPIEYPFNLKAVE